MTLDVNIAVDSRALEAGLRRARWVLSLYTLLLWTDMEPT